MTRREKQALVAECRASGLTAKAWCEEKGIDYRQYVIPLC
ncbi:IS66 family insertion sequence element accessory protein TnpA [Heliobacterium mobile]